MDFHLHPKQGDAFLSEATEILYGGAAGGGKSHLFRVASIAWSIAIPGLQSYLFRRKYPDLWHNHMEGPTSYPLLLAEWIKAGIAKINWGDAMISFSSGSQIHLCHCQHPKDVYNYQGAEIHVLMIDELTQWERSMYTFLRGRVRLGGLKVPDKYKGLFPRILNGANPGGIGHNWVKAAWIDLGEPMEIHDMPKSEGGMRRQYVPALLEDNPTLTENDPDYESRLEGLGNAALVKAMRHGIWDIVAGGAVDDVWDRTRHVIPPFEIPATWRIDRSFDWGSSAPFSAGFWAESDGSQVRLADGSSRTFPKGTLFRIGEVYGWNGKPNEGCRKSAASVAKEIKGWEVRLGRPVLPGPADTSIWDADDTGVSIADKMAREGIRWEKADKSPGSRKAGLEEVRDRLRASLQSPMERPGLFIFSACTHFIRTVPVLPRDERDPDDVDTKAEDHVFDEARYRCAFRRHITTSQEFLL